MAKNTANLLSGLSNSKTRTFVIIFGAIILFGVAIAVLRGKSDQSDVLSKQGSQVLAVPADIKATPGSVVPEKQRELLMKENERRAQEALQKKSSAIPTIIGSITNPADKNSADAAAVDEAMKNQQRDKIGRLGLGDASGGGFAGGGAFGAGGQGANGLGGLGGAGSLNAGGLAGAGGLGANGLPPGYSIGPGGILIGPDGKPVLGPDGKPIIIGADGKLPPGYSIGPGGILIGPDGKPVLGPDGKPIVMGNAALLAGGAGALGAGGAGALGAGGAGALGAGGAGGLGAGGAFGAGGAGALGAGGAGGLGAGSDNPFGKTPAERARELQEQRLREQRELQEKQRAEQERQRELERQRRLAEQQQRDYDASVQKIQTQMKSAASAAYNDWNKVTPQAYVQGALASKPFKSNTADTSTAKATGTSSSTSGSPSAARFGNQRVGGKKVFIKAGSILFGVIDTAVNTDEPGPVLATIVGGKYTGGKLIGTFTHQAQQTSLTLSFNQMTVPKRAKSFGVSVVAIDPDTARTALATDYDRHLLQRYGNLFLSSFLQGYGQAVSQQGTTTTSPLTGTTTTTTPPLDGKQQFYVAMGEVGKQWSQAIKPYFNTPYTVTVDQGSSVGLLFLSDVDVSDD